MQLYKSSLGILFCLLISVGAVAQAESTTIITESSDPLSEVYVDDVVQKKMMMENRVLPYEPVREADIPWERRIWRIIDIREKRNQVFAYPLEPFFSIVAEAAGNGEIAVFQDEEFKERMTTKELDDKLVSTDTSMVIDPVTYEQTLKVTRSEINPEDIKRYRVKEVWYFDEETSQMKVRILGIAPIKEYYDEDTNLFKYEAPLFWIYYPEARETFAKHQVFNNFNDASMMTWHDLFEMRMFASYIYKQSNIHDFRLKDIYEDGIDRLLESEKIKSELFNWEHDLWTY